MRWHLLLSPPLPGVENMAIDDALMSRAARTGDGVVRVYAWGEPTLSLGRNQHARGIYTAERACALGVAVVRRATGGRALLHHREITYSVTAPAAEGESLARSYAAINQALLDALRILGVDAALAGDGPRLPPPGSAPCFERPARGEVILGGRKLVGSAQCRERGAMLQHGSILVGDDQAIVARLATTETGAVVPAATLAEALGRTPSPGEFADALFSVVRDRWDPSARALSIDAAHDPAFDAARDAARARFADDAWTWRR